MSPHIYYTQNFSLMSEINCLYFSDLFSSILKGKIHIVSLKGAFVNRVEFNFFNYASTVCLVLKGSGYLFLITFTVALPIRGQEFL